MASMGTEGLRFHDPNLNYVDQGEKYLQQLREEIRKRELDEAAGVKFLDTKGRMMIKQNQPKEDIMEMTPAQKQEFLARKKL